LSFCHFAQYRPPPLEPHRFFRKKTPGAPSLRSLPRTKAGRAICFPPRRRPRCLVSYGRRRPSWPRGAMPAGAEQLPVDRGEGQTSQLQGQTPRRAMPHARLAAIDTHTASPSPLPAVQDRLRYPAAFPQACQPPAPAIEARQPPAPAIQERQLPAPAVQEVQVSSGAVHDMNSGSSSSRGVFLNYGLCDVGFFHFSFEEII
jgi:hypothetical protein